MKKRFYGYYELTKDQQSKLHDVGDKLWELRNWARFSFAENEIYGPDTVLTIRAYRLVKPHIDEVLLPLLEDKRFHVDIQAGGPYHFDIVVHEGGET